MLKVVDIEFIRRLHFRKGWSIRRIAKELHHSRKTVRKALQDPGPWEYRMSRPRPAPKVGPYRELVRQWRLEDGNAPRQQRHTARRIYQRLREDRGYEGAESSLRRVVAQPRRELDTAGPEPFLVRPPSSGRRAQVAGAQAKIVLAGVATVIHLFC